ncbi:MAG: outer membrane protein assembly factor BamD [Rickettsiales bacterium]|jgi:outer membrane protein assembly factor BamD
MKKILQIFIIFSLVTVFSCSGPEKKEVPSAEIDYIKALKKMKAKDYLSAAEDFRKINDEYPLSKWGSKAITMAAFGFYKEGQLEDVVVLAEEFIRDNPSNPNVDYMHYLKSISYYDQMNDIARAQDNAKLSSYSFRELVARFPRSKYSTDARTKLILVDDHIAGAKMNIGRYQIEARNYVGAIKSFQEVVNNYSRTNQTPEAYFRLYETHLKIGMKKISAKYRQELKQKYPSSSWTKLK